MPELPDLTVVADALHASITGRAVRSAEAPGPLAVRGTPTELAGLIGQRVESIRRRGKFLLIALERDEIACNPMLTGRFQLAAPGDKLPTRTAFVLGFGERPRGLRGPDRATRERRVEGIGNHGQIGQFGHGDSIVVPERPVLDSPGPERQDS